METTLQNYDLPESEVLRSIEPNPWNSNEDGIRVFDEPELEDYVEDINDINDIVDINNEEDLILISSANNGKAITVNKVIASTSLPEFPDTLSSGIGYLVSTQGMTTSQRVLASQNVQYCKKLTYPDKQSFCAFLDTNCIRSTFNCSGVKYCEYLDPSIQSMNHTQLSESDFQKIIDLRKLRSASTRRSEANSLFLSVSMQFRSRKACGQAHTNTCKPVFCRSNHQNVAGNFLCWVSCINKSNENTHYFKAITTWLNEELPFLEHRFSDDFEPQYESCYVVEQTSARKADCGVDHAQGRGHLQLHNKCSVIFRLFMPINIQDCPYFLWTSHGEHCHPPPIPSSAPSILISELISIIRRINDPSLTTNTLLRNPLMHTFYEQYNGRSLGEIHKSMTNMDRISLVLRKQQLLLYPEGQHINGLQYEYEQNHKNSESPYIQELYTDTANLMVICCFQEAARVLLSLESFEVDMTFKRIKDSSINEVVFAGFINDHNKVMTFVRVYVNQDSTAMYYELFTRVFRVLSQITGKPVHWQHLHGSGFGALVMDMDSKQMSGFGRYLSSIDPQNRPWQWHARHTLIYCSIHFKRGITKAVGTSNPNPWFQRTMGELLETKSMADYQQLCDEIIESPNATPAIQRWAAHKKLPIIAAGLNRYCSQIDQALFERTRRHTNAVEQTHFKTGSFGKKLTLLKAVKMGEIADKRDIDQYLAKAQHGVHPSWHAGALSARFRLSDSRERSRKRQRTSTQGEDIGLHLTQQDELDVLSQASSSGYSRPSRRSSSQSSRSRTRAIPLRQNMTRNIPSERERIELQVAAAEARRLEIANEKSAAEARRLEIDNERAELELMKLRKELQNSA